MPSVVNAPMPPFTTTATAKTIPVRPSASPPGGNTSICRSRMNRAVTNSATASPIWILRFGRPLTIPAPNHAPITLAPIIATRVNDSTWITVMNSTPSRKVGSAWPTLSVPGISSSSTTEPSLSTVDVVANDPTPSVSRKSVTKPRPSRLPKWKRRGASVVEGIGQDTRTSRSTAHPSSTRSWAAASSASPIATARPPSSPPTRPGARCNSKP